MVPSPTPWCVHGAKQLDWPVVSRTQSIIIKSSKWPSACDPLGRAQLHKRKLMTAPSPRPVVSARAGLKSARAGPHGQNWLFHISNIYKNSPTIPPSLSNTIRNDFTNVFIPHTIYFYSHSINRTTNAGQQGVLRSTDWTHTFLFRTMILVKKYLKK